MAQSKTGNQKRQFDRKTEFQWKQAEKDDRNKRTDAESSQEMDYKQIIDIILFFIE